MLHRFYTFNNKPHSAAERARLMVVLAFGFVGLAPMAIFNSYRLDRLLGLPPINASPTVLLITALVGLAGLGLALWTITMQWAIGKGTPAPMMPTQQLITSGPFALVRNPMSLGTILAYLALAIFAGSISAIFLIIVIGFILLSYMKRYEEEQLLHRFGEPYRSYRDRVPFLIPRIPSRR